jgi:hypothetical protein
VEPLPVLKDFDPFEDRGARLRSRGEVSPMDQVAFETAPEALHQRVVVAVAFTAHARLDTGLAQSLPVSFAGVLHSPIGVMDQSARGAADA